MLEAALAAPLSGSSGSRSRLEKRFRRLVVGAGFPAPRQNVEVNGFEVDAYWPGLCVEIDGVGHRRARTKVDDRIRDAALRAAGYAVLRFTEDDVDFRPEQVLAELAAQELPVALRGSEATGSIVLGTLKRASRVAAKSRSSAGRAARAGRRGR